MTEKENITFVRFEAPETPGTFSTQLQATTKCGDVLELADISVTTKRPVTVENVADASFFAEVRPLPLSAESTLFVQLDRPEDVSVYFYDMLGRQVAQQCITQTTHVAMKPPSSSSALFVMVEVNSVRKGLLLTP